MIFYFLYRILYSNIWYVGLCIFCIQRFILPLLFTCFGNVSVVSQDNKADWWLCYHLRQGAHVFAGVCLSVFLSVSNITRKVVDGFGWQEMSAVGPGTSDYIGGWSVRCHWVQHSVCPGGGLRSQRLFWWVCYCYLRTAVGLHILSSWCQCRHEC